MINDSSKWVQLKLPFKHRRGGIMPGSVYPAEPRECVSCLKTGRWLDAECSYCKKAKARLKRNRNGKHGEIWNAVDAAVAEVADYPDWKKT